MNEWLLDSPPANSCRPWLIDRAFRHKLIWVEGIRGLKLALNKQNRGEIMVKRVSSVRICKYCKKQIVTSPGPGRPNSIACQRVRCQVARHGDNIRACIIKRIKYEKLQHELKV
jgi:hypothetical protein